MGFRVFDYKGHFIQLDEVPVADSTSWIVYVDRHRVGGRDTERAASDFAYATVDRLEADAELRPRLVELVAARAHVTGPAFDPALHEVGQPVWAQWRGMWRRGVVSELKGSKVEVALVVAADAPKVRRTWGPYSSTVIARFAEG